MLRLPKLTDYAVVILSVMARSGDEILATGAIAARTGLAVPTVAKILKTLTKASLVEAQRGPRGGYRLALPQTKISMADIVAAMNGPIAMTDCIAGHDGKCEVEHRCAQRGQWDKVNNAIQAALAGVTLAEMIPSQGEEQRARRAAVF